MKMIVKLFTFPALTLLQQLLTYTRNVIDQIIEGQQVTFETQGEKTEEILLKC